MGIFTPWSPIGAVISRLPDAPVSSVVRKGFHPIPGWG